MLVVFCACFVSHAALQRATSAPPEFLPNPDRLKALESNPDDHPLFLMKLLRYGDEEGAEVYRKYCEVAVSRIRELGGDVVFPGKARPFPIDFGGAPSLFGFGPHPWDAVIFERYPSRKDLRKMEEFEDYRAATARLQDRLEETVVYALNGSPILGDTRSSAETEAVPNPPSPEAVYMLNLVRFKPEDGKRAYLEDYGKQVMPMIEKHDGKLIFGLAPEQLLTGTETYDRVILVMYPSVEAFTNMILSEEYQKISHHRSNALEIGHLIGFSNAAAAQKVPGE